MTSDLSDPGALTLGRFSIGASLLYVPDSSNSKCLFALDRNTKQQNYKKF